MLFLAWITSNKIARKLQNILRKARFFVLGFFARGIKKRTERKRETTERHRCEPVRREFAAFGSCHVAVYIAVNAHIARTALRFSIAPSAKIHSVCHSASEYG